MSSCSSCRAPFGFFSRSHKCGVCHKGPLCGKCADHVVIQGTFVDGNAKAVNSCIECAKANSSIDFTQTVDVIGPAKGEAPCIMMVHGGGSCRKMFLGAARFFAAKGFRCVLPDLPGHGSRYAEALTLDLAAEAIRECAETHCAPFRGVAPIYLGASFGGYTGMEALGRYPLLFSGAIIIVATQTVGEGASLKASMALGALASVYGMMWGSTLVNGLIGSVKQEMKNLNLPDLDESSIRGGWWFEKGLEQVRVLQATRSQQSMRNYRGPVLYVTGEKDHHDMEAELHGISKKNEEQDLDMRGRPHPPRTQSLVYKGESHFLTHSLKSQPRFHDDVASFVDAVLADAAALPK